MSALFSRIRQDVRSARDRDPAARTNAEVFFTYPGVHAVWWYRVAHRLWLARRYFIARAISQFARFLTGVEIHPGATIGDRLFIDHGMGVVIGETAVLGNDVMLYHGVTLGGRNLTRVKRHPTLGDGVIVGTGATILGDVTIGAGSVVGAQAVVVHDAPARSKITGVPAKAVPLDTPLGNPDAATSDFFIDPAIYI